MLSNIIFLFVLLFKGLRFNKEKHAPVLIFVNKKEHGFLIEDSKTFCSLLSPKSIDLDFHTLV